MSDAIERGAARMVRNGSDYIIENGLTGRLVGNPDQKLHCVNCGDRALLLRKNSTYLSFGQITFISLEEKKIISKCKVCKRFTAFDLDSGKNSLMA